MELFLLAALAMMGVSQVLVHMRYRSEIDELEEHFDELNESVDERFQGQLEIINAVHTQVDGIESNIERKGISSLTLQSADIPSDKIREGLVKFGAKERKLKSAKDMTFNLAKPKKKQARKTR